MTTHMTTPMSDNETLAAMALDLKRVAEALERGSPEVAKRFTKEALARGREVNPNKLPDYIKKILKETNTTLQKHSADRTPEDCLMYSTLLQNFAFHR